MIIGWIFAIVVEDVETEGNLDDNQVVEAVMGSTNDEDQAESNDVDFKTMVLRDALINISKKYISFNTGMQSQTINFSMCC